jgi:hypothetical protein
MKVGTGNLVVFKRDILEIFALLHFLAFFLEISIHTQIIGSSKEVNTKKKIWVYGWISGEVCKISDVETYNARIKKASKR